jgi:predicted O-methyltransferase YrrM
MALKRWDVLARLAKEFGLKRFAEIGVKAGRNTVTILQLVPDSHVIAVDPWAWWSLLQPGECERQFDRRCRNFEDRITKHKMLGVESALLVPDGSLDCVFIDDDHKYDTTKANIEAWLPKLRKGGIMAGHDIQSRFPGVDKVVAEKFPAANIEPDHVWWVQC